MNTKTYFCLLCPFPCFEAVVPEDSLKVRLLSNVINFTVDLMQTVSVFSYENGQRSADDIELNNMKIIQPKRGLRAFPGNSY